MSPVKGSWNGNVSPASLQLLCFSLESEALGPQEESAEYDSPRQGKAQGVLEAARRWSFSLGLSPDCSHICCVSIQLKTQLEQTEAILEDEQTRRQKLTAEFEEVSPCQVALSPYKLSGLPSLTTRRHLD